MKFLAAEINHIWEEPSIVLYLTVNDELAKITERLPSDFCSTHSDQELKERGPISVLYPDTST